MRNTLAIAWKECKGYFAQPVAYVVAAVFLFVTGFFFIDGLSGPLPEAGIRGYVLNIWWVLFVLALGGILAMRLLAEEQKLGTVELLLTSPVRDSEVIMGKFLGSISFFLAMVVITFFYPLLLHLFGSPDNGPIMTAYLGILLMGFLAFSVGLFASSLTNNQIISAIVSMGILFMLWFLYLGEDFLGGNLADFFSFMSLRNHYRDFSVGIIETKSVIYLISMAAMSLFLAIRSLESRRWR
ncbi:MAG: ABC transporter permease subunit [Chloroflexi bacterium]|nr:ABC transporter permease subunit [Chloroflexota bacterium]